ncbi:hypothetical protein ACFVYF_18950 [Streptomyces sp. NPDC058274]|uniref:hypothetical protein n=1 Tax=Streptomyces sp. NPDC058274 TaxID=3346416 RepID=UPI0036E651D1
MAPRTATRSRRKPKETIVIKGQGDLLTEWRESGLITDSQLATFTREHPYPAKKGF